MLTCRAPHLSDYAQVDLQVCNGLQAIASAGEQELRDMQLTFEPPNGTAFALPHGEHLPVALAKHCAAMFDGGGLCREQCVSTLLSNALMQPPYTAQQQAHCQSAKQCLHKATLQAVTQGNATS